MDGRELEQVQGQPLPLATAQENPPLVLDLPEGQKLVVGNLDPGIVIEIATWRGTGRPDSRTNRLMLGVSTNEDEDIPRTRSLPPVESVQQIEQVYQPIAQPIAQPVPQPVPQPMAQMPYQQIERTGIIYSNLNPTRDAGQLAKIETKEKKRNTNVLKRVLIATGSVSSMGAIAFVLFGVIGLQFALPSSGFRTTFGAAHTSVLLINPNAELAIGENVLTDLPFTNENPTVTVVAGVDKAAILLATETAYAQVRPESVRGTVVLSFPFIGAIANLVGN